jgi:hypothetical protein
MNIRGFQRDLVGMAVEVAAAQRRYQMKICRDLFHLIAGYKSLDGDELK